MKDKSSLDSFINKFAFNKDADFQYFLNGLLDKKPYIEKLKISISSLIKSQKQYKKNLTTVKIKTDRNAKKISESINELESDYLKTVDLLKDTHHFIITLLKVDILNKELNSYKEVYDKFGELNSNFSELLQQLDFSKEDKLILNTFNRMRNVIIHAPSGIIIGYLTENVLEEFRSVVNLLIGVSNDILERNKDVIHAILFINQKEIVDSKFSGVENAKTFAAAHGLTINELLEIIKNSNYDCVVEIHQDMLLDAFIKEAINPKVESKVKEKNKAIEKQRLSANLNQLYNLNTKLVVDFDYILNQCSNDIDKAYNHIYDLFNDLSINKIEIVFNTCSKEIMKSIDELLYITKSTENELMEYFKTTKDYTTIAYCEQNIIDSLDSLDSNKFFIQNLNFNENVENCDWNKIVLHKNKVIDIMFMEGK